MEEIKIKEIVEDRVGEEGSKYMKGHASKEIVKTYYRDELFSDQLRKITNE